jgi:hypothetical protein
MENVNNRLVVHPLHGVGVLEQNSNGNLVTVLFYKDTMLRVKASDLRPIELGEYMLFRLPNGKWMHGRQNAYLMGTLYLAFLALSIYGMTQLTNGAGWLGMVLAPLAVIGMCVRGVVKNWKGKQM